MNSQAISLPRAWVTMKVMPEHLQPSGVRSSVWIYSPHSSASCHL